MQRLHRFVAALRSVINIRARSFSRVAGSADAPVIQTLKMKD
jgi:hypothetical protein